MIRLRPIMRAMMVVLGLAAAGVFSWNRFLKNASLYPVLGTVDDFSLTDQSGKTVTKESLKGKFWVASFIFTQCHGPCPLITLKTSQLEKDFRDPRLAFVSFSVD